MKILAGFVAVICLILIFVTWNSPLAIAWAVAFAGWLPHVFPDRKRATDGYQA
jgi:hypothetical protein